MPILLHVLVAAVLSVAVPQTPPAQSPHDQLWALFGEEWDWTMQAYPEQATFDGDDRFDDQLTDQSVEAIAKRQAHEREMLAQAKAFGRAGLTAPDALSLDLFVYQLQQDVDGFRFHDEYFQLNQLDSPPADFTELARAIPRAHVKDLENFLARMRALPKQIDQQIALLKLGIVAGITPPKVTLTEVPKLLANHLPDDPAKSPIYQTVFADLPQTIPAADQQRLRAQAKEVLVHDLFPAFKRLRDYARDEYVPKARTTLGASELPDGKAWYAHDVQVQTTSDKTPDEIHAIGLAEVERIEKEMDALRAKAGFKGDRKAFFKFLKSDQRFFYKSASDLVVGFRDIAKRIDPQLPLHFKTLPRLTYGVSPMPEYQAKTSPAAFYEPGAPDTGRAGIFMANTYELKARPKWAMEDLTLHEAVPGHHLQIARAQELTDLPKFRRYGGFTAYVEGWALYCESLGEELGLYEDVYAKFGQLSAEMWRAVRLVVDTGIHAKGWTRDQAIAFFREHAGQSELNTRVEVDRYIVWPGQALAYKLGQLLIRSLRTDAERALGDKFDEREFHDVVLGAGPLPLPVLEKRVRDWIAEQGAQK